MSAAGDLNRALELARQLVSLVQAERAQAEAAAAFLQHWAEDAPTDVNGCCLRISEAARLLDTTVDALYNWERNGLIDVPRNPGNGYRLYRPPEIGRLRVIRMLLRSGYSMMAILRMLLKIDQGQVRGLRQALDTPRPDEDAIYASDHWLTVLAEQEERARHTVAMLKEQFRKDQ
jgi:DNA-binding transcriptional MerR regulator